MKLDDFLDLLIPHLKTLQKDENAEPFYELMSGAFIWEDEKVRGLNTYELGCLRGIFRYRTSLISREPDERFASLWNALRERNIQTGSDSRPSDARRMMLLLSAIGRKGRRSSVSLG
jgi:hypothetical protein